MPEVREARTAGERQPDHVEIRADDVILIIDVGSIQPSMRISRHQRPARCRARSVNRPAVRAGVRVLHPADSVQAVRQLIDPIQEIAVILIARRRDYQMSGLVAFEQDRRPFRSERVDQLGAPQLALEHAHHYVPHLEYGQRILREPRLRLGAGQRVLYGQRVRRSYEGVHTVRVSEEHVARIVRQRFPVLEH